MVEPSSEEPRPIPPESLLSGVGQGDFAEIGDLTVALLERYSGLRPVDRVLDVGCGLGRVAWPLSRRLGPRGSYEGFDVVRAYTDWCVANLGLDAARFCFRHVDLRNRFYNPEGSVRPEDFVFPYTDASFDLAIATSLFTHLLPSAVERYLKEIARTLAPSGRLFATYFLIDDRAQDSTRQGAMEAAFPFAIENGRLHDAATPESVVALEAEWVLGALADAGLSVIAIHPGRWHHGEGPFYQDVVTAVRP